METEKMEKNGSIPVVFVPSGHPEQTVEEAARRIAEELMEMETNRQIYE